VTGQPHVVYLAHHMLLLALPAFAPAVIVAGVVVYVAVRDRRRRYDAPPSDGTDSSGHDDRP
jgi:hypothetical protein